MSEQVNNESDQQPGAEPEPKANGKFGGLLAKGSAGLGAVADKIQAWVMKVTGHPDDVEGKPALPEVAETEIRAATHIFMLLSGVLVIVFGTWASCSRLDIMSVCNGEVVPSGNNKKVQHLEGGIVKAILVKEGELVAKGQPLIEMEATASEASLNELQIRSTSLELEILRLAAELANEATLKAPEHLLAEHPELVKQAEDVFQANMAEIRNVLASQEKQITQRRQAYSEIEARLRNEKKRHELLKEQIRINEDLLKDDLTSRYQHLELLKQENVLNGSIEENAIALQRAQSALEEQESKRSSLISTHKKRLQEELADARRSFDELQQRLRKFTDNLQRAVLRAPVAGIVKTLYVVTEGGVVRPGSTLLDIVPQDEKLIIEAKLPTRDIGYVKLGQTALVRLASADAFKYGVLEGEVIAISPNTKARKATGLLADYCVPALGGQHSVD